MNNFKFTRALIFLITLFFSSNLSAAEIIWTGPNCVTQGEIVEYQIDRNVGWFCNVEVGFNIGELGGEILSVTDANGVEVGEIANMATSWATNNSLGGGSFPLTVLIQIGNINLGCRSISMGLAATPGFTCTGRDFKFFPVLVQGSATGNFNEPEVDYEISIDPQNSTGTIETCSIVEICLDNELCTNIKQWTINNNIINTSKSCIEYTVTSCPINVQVEFTNNCSDNAETLQEVFQCDDVVSPDLEFPLSVCLGEIWSVDVPGSIVDVNVLSFSQGNKINITNNMVWFEATHIGTVVLQLTYEICGRTYSKFIVVSVNGCAGVRPAGENLEYSIEARSTKVDTDTKINTDKVFNIYPNPARNTVNFDFSDMQDIPTSISLFDSSSRLVLEFIPDTTKKEIDISNLNEGLYIIKANYLTSNPITKKLVVSK